MPDEIRAIFEHGVLRPLQPLGLNEAEQVVVVVHRASSEAPDEERRKRLQQSLEEAWSCRESGLETPFTARDHDRLLYGESS